MAKGNGSRNTPFPVFSPSSSLAKGLKFCYILHLLSGNDALD